MSTDLLIPYHKNMNKHTDEQIDQLVELISYQGFRVPLVAQKGTNIIASGHGRWMAAKKMGLKEVPVILEEFENEAQFYAFVVSDNAINAKDWGGGLDLSQVNIDILDFGPELNIEMLGIKDFTIEPLEKIELEDNTSKDDENKKWILEVTFPNEMELRDIHDDLVYRGYIVKEK